ncbi:MAG TPA: PAS domain S-box protein [Ohtaekwangia sp.]|uniref:PAS domain S-box protein n=1 Tax=Ohtaekwangia sp. TaxID=2066019 RepID=UPI002F93206B
MRKGLCLGLLLFMLLAVTYTSQAQQAVVDSLYEVLKTLPQDTNRVNTLAELCDEQSYLDNEKMPAIAQEMITLSQQIGFPKGEAKAYIFLGVYNGRSGNPTKAVDFFYKALHIYETLQNTRRIAACYNNIGVIFLDQKDNEQALRHFHKALEAWQKIGFKTGMSRAWGNIAYIYEEANKDSLALEYYTKAMAIERETDDKPALGNTFLAIGGIYFKRGNLSEALQWEQQALQIVTSCGSVSRYSPIYSGLSEIYIAQHKFSEALEAAKKAVRYARESNIKNDIADSYLRLSKAYEAVSEFNQAYLYQSRYIALNDSLLSADARSSIESLRHNHEMERKEMELSLMAHQNKLEVYRRNSLVIGLAGSICILLLILSRQRLSLKKRKEVERKNQLLMREKLLRRESEDKYRTLIESTLLGVCIAKDDRIIYANKTLLDIFGYADLDTYSEEQIPRVTSHATPETKALIRELKEKRVADENTYHQFIGHFYDKDHKVRSFEVQADNIALVGTSCRMYVLIEVTERLAAEQSSRDMEKLFRLSLNFSNIGSWRWDITTNSLLWSETTYKIYGLPVSSGITGETFMQYVHPDDRDKVRECASTCIQNGEPYHVEHRFYGPNGDIRWARLKGDVFRNSNGEPVEIFGVARDITESKHIAEELRLSKEKYQLLAEVGHEILGLYNLDGVMEYVSPAITTVLGYLPEEVVGNRLVDPCIHPMDRRQLILGFKDAIRYSGKTSNVKVRIQRKNSNEYVWCQMSFKAVYDRDGKVTSVRSLSRDIGYEIAYELKLSQSNARLTNSLRAYKSLNKRLQTLLKELRKRSGLLESINKKLIDSQDKLKHTYRQLRIKTDALNQIAIIISSDAKGIITDVNQMFEKVMGYSRAEVVGLGHRELQANISGSQGPEFFDGIWNQLKEGNDWRGEVCYRTKSGELVWWLKHITPLINDGVFEGYFSFSYDITLNKKREEEIIEAKHMAEAASAIKEDFLSVMSHEIRTPLNSVIGLSNLLLNKNPREDQHEIIKTLKNSSDNLMYLVNDILDFNKIQAGKIEREEIAFNTLELLQQFQSAYQPIAHEKGLDFKVTADAVIPPMLIGDSMRLNQVLNNLVNNALKFTQRGFVKVKVSLAARQGNQCKLSFEVSDSGIGISEEKLPLIFKPFHQSEKYISRQFGGTGLGLSIVSSLVELLGGDITVTSIVGEGSVFSVTLPFTVCMDTMPVVRHKEKNDISLLASFRGYRVLYVEDVESNRMLIAAYMKDHGVECTMAPDGDMALFHTANKIFDVILMDIQMPGRDGYEVTKAIRSQVGGRNIHTPVIAFTAESLSEELKERVAQNNIQDILTKPFQFDALVKKIIKVSPQKRKEEEFLSFRFYEEALNYDSSEIREIQKIVLSDFKLFGANLAKYVDEKNIEGIRAEIHKLSPIVKNLKCTALMKAFEEMKKHQQYSSAVTELYTELNQYNHTLCEYVMALQY